MSAKHPIDQKLSDMFRREDAPVSDALWDRIESSLVQKKRRKVFWYYVFGLTAAFLVLGIGSLLVFKDCNKKHAETGNVTKIQHIQGQSNPHFESEEKLPTDNIELPNNGVKANVVRLKVQKGNVLQIEHQEPLNLVRTKDLTIDMVAKFSSLFSDWTIQVPELLGPIVGDNQITKIKPWSESDVKIPKPVYLGIHFNTGLLTEGLKAVGGAENFINRSFFEVINNSRSRFTQSNAGLDFSVQLNRHLMISSGINVTRRVQAYEYDYSITEFPVIDQRVGIVSYLPLAPQDQIHVNLISTNAQNFVDVPLIAEWTFARIHRFSFGLRSGIYVGKSFRPEGLIPDEGTLVLTDLTDKMRSGWNSSGHLGVSLNYNAGKKLMLSAEPLWIKNMNTVSTPESNLRSNPEMKGINIRLLYRINP